LYSCDGRTDYATVNLYFIITCPVGEMKVRRPSLGCTYIHTYIPTYIHTLNETCVSYPDVFFIHFVVKIILHRL